jgi:uncharacterized protein YdbL (DUF1318 family)
MSSASIARRALIVGVVALVSVPALALDLDQARTTGVIGERPDGLVGTVVAPVRPEIKMLVDTVNRERLAAYRELAAKDGTPLDAVQKVAGEKQIAKARAQGWYYMEPTGSWHRD